MGGKRQRADYTQGDRGGTGPRRRPRALGRADNAATGDPGKRGADATRRNPDCTPNIGYLTPQFRIMTGSPRNPRTPCETNPQGVGHVAPERAGDTAAIGDPAPSVLFNGRDLTASFCKSPLLRIDTLRMYLLAISWLLRKAGWRAARPPWGALWPPSRPRPFRAAEMGQIPFVGRRSGP